MTNPVPLEGNFRVSWGMAGLRWVREGGGLSPDRDVRDLTGSDVFLGIEFDLFPSKTKSFC